MSKGPPGHPPASENPRAPKAPKAQAPVPTSEEQRTGSWPRSCRQALGRPRTPTHQSQPPPTGSRTHCQSPIALVLQCRWDRQGLACLSDTSRAKEVTQLR